MKRQLMAQVLIVDDDLALLKLVGLLLNKVPVEHSMSADSGTKALELINTHTFSLVILDLMLPDMDGFEVLRRVRAQNQFDLMSVLILSAKADPNTIRYALDNGADGYVTKPYLASNLIDRVRTLLTEHRNHHQV
jgi:DNA-binding response OmpR family regulator